MVGEYCTLGVCLLILPFSSCLLIPSKVISHTERSVLLKDPCGKELRSALTAHLWQDIWSEKGRICFDWMFSKVLIYSQLCVIALSVRKCRVSQQQECEAEADLFIEGRKHNSYERNKLEAGDKTYPSRLGCELVAEPFPSKAKTLDLLPGHMKLYRFQRNFSQFSLPPCRLHITQFSYVSIAYSTMSPLVRQFIDHIRVPMVCLISISW